MQQTNKYCNRERSHTCLNDFPELWRSLDVEAVAHCNERQGGSILRRLSYLHQYIGLSEFVASLRLEALLQLQTASHLVCMLTDRL